MSTTGREEQFRPAPVDEGAYHTALHAFDLLDHGAQTGEWQPFLDLLDDDVTWFGPVEGFQGLHRGKQSAAELFAHHSQATRTHWQLKNVSADGNEISLEARAEGTIDGKSYANQLLMLLVIERDRIRHFREYAGYVQGVGDYVGISTIDDGRETFAYKGR